MPKTYFPCPKCGHVFLLIGKTSMEKGDKPTEAKCAFCGFWIHC